MALKIPVICSQLDTYVMDDHIFYNLQVKDSKKKK